MPAFVDAFDVWDAGRYFVYPATWYDTSKHGRYDPTAISVSDGLLRLRIATVDGQPRSVAFVPLLPDSASARGDWPGMRVTFRIRADLMPGWKGVPLLWPVSGHDWPYWGEINWPEGNFDKQPAGFMHRQEATVGWDQDYVLSAPGTTWQDWHTYTIEWLPDHHATFVEDGQVLATFTDRVPAGPMHLVMQFETNLDGYVPDPSVAGHVEIDWLRIEVPTGG